MCMSFGVTRSNTLSGQNVSLSNIQNESRQRDHIHNAKYPSQITTRKVLEREAKIVTLAQHRMGEYKPFAPNHRVLEIFTG